MMSGTFVNPRIVVRSGTHFSARPQRAHPDISGDRPTIPSIERNAQSLGARGKAMHDHDIRPVERSATGPRGQAGPPDAHEDGSHAGGHSMWWMVVCCAPMVLIALALALGLLSR
jgi:hypothetical protein